MLPGSGGQCQSPCPNGATDPASLQSCIYGYNPVPVNGVYYCLNGAPANPQPPAPGAETACIAQSPLTNAANCPQGWTPTPFPAAGGLILCLPTPQQATCSAGMNVGLNGTCQQLCPAGDWPYPTTQCCATGETPAANGICCPAGGTPNPNTGQCCAPGSPYSPGLGRCQTTNCPPGEVAGPTFGTCVTPPARCPDGQVQQSNGSCACPPGEVKGATYGTCVPVYPRCRTGEVRTAHGCERVTTRPHRPVKRPQKPVMRPRKPSAPTPNFPSRRRR